MELLNDPARVARIEQLAARVAESDGSVVAIVRAAESEDAAASDALLLTTLIADEHTRVILANLASSGGLDTQAAASGPEGLSQALQGKVRVSDITSRLPGSAAFFFRAGQHRVPAAEVLGSRAFENLVASVVEGAGLILVYVPAEELPESSDFGLAVDGVVVIGDSLPGATECLGARIIGRLDLPPRPEVRREPAVVQTSAGGMAMVRESDRDSARRRWKPRWRSEPGSPGPLQVIAVWLFAAVFVFVAWQAYAGWPAFEGGIPEPDSEGVQLPLRETVGGEQGSPAEAAPPVSPTSAGNAETGDPVEAFDAVRDSPYSILIASYTRWDDAQARVDEIEDSTDEVVFVAPTPLRGRVYYRVFVGASRDEADGLALMDTLVSDGLKEERRAWDMRPSRFAWLLGVFGSREEAAVEMNRLRSLELPVYILETGSVSEEAYAVYSGAYESQEAAQALGQMLEDAGAEAQFVVRKGVSR